MAEEFAKSELQPEDERAELKKEIKSGRLLTDDDAQFLAVRKYVGLILEEGQKDPSTDPTDYQKELEGSLGPESGRAIHAALEDYWKKTALPPRKELQADIRADPVMMFNGQFIQTVQDFRINGAGLDFVFVRTYRNQGYYNGPLGFNWDHNCNLWLRIEGESIIRSSGELREDHYRKHQTYNYYLPPDGFHDVIEANGTSFVLLMPNGTKLVYEQIDATDLHRVAAIRDRNENALQFRYDQQG